MRLLVISYRVPEDKQEAFQDVFYGLREMHQGSLYPGTGFLTTNDPDPKLIERVTSHFNEFVQTPGMFVMVWDYARSTCSASIGGDELNWMRQAQKENQDDQNRIVEEYREKVKKELEGVQEQVLRETREKLRKMFSDAGSRMGLMEKLNNLLSQE